MQSHDHQPGDTRLRFPPQAKLAGVAKRSTTSHPRFREGLPQSCASVSGFASNRPLIAIKSSLMERPWYRNARFLIEESVFASVCWALQNVPFIGKSGERDCHRVDNLCAVLLDKLLRP